MYCPRTSPFDTAQRKQQAQRAARRRAASATSDVAADATASGVALHAESPSEASDDGGDLRRLTKKRRDGTRGRLEQVSRDLATVGRWRRTRAAHSGAPMCKRSGGIVRHGLGHPTWRAWRCGVHATAMCRAARLTQQLASCRLTSVLVCVRAVCALPMLAVCWHEGQRVQKAAGVGVSCQLLFAARVAHSIGGTQCGV